MITKRSFADCSDGDFNLINDEDKDDKNSSGRFNQTFHIENELSNYYNDNK